MPLTVWWIRRDLRLYDNPALHHALSYGNPVVPLFILDPKLLNSPYVGQKRLAFLYGGLRSLADDLKALGSQLIIRNCDPHNVLTQLVQRENVTNIVVEADITPFATRRDQAIQATLPLHLTPGLSVVPTGSVLKDDGTPYTMYAPYNRRWQANCTLSRKDILPRPIILTEPHPVLPSDAIPDSPTLDQGSSFIPGEGEAQRRYEAFLFQKSAPIDDYAQERNRPDHEGTSQLSPYLRFGMISPRILALAAQDAIQKATDDVAREGAQTWLDELIWRDFYQTILMCFPHSRRNSFYAKYDAIQWRNDPLHFEAWCAGGTGYPYIDAAMRQLATTGWMHNRARMAVAAFLIKDLLIDWRWGEKWFMQQLLDGDPAANNGGWQWSAGSGPNAAPYFRVFNPITQGTKFDPEGAYVRRWVPELANIPTKYIHTPWKMSPSEQARTRLHIGKDYPIPIVDHEQARETTLAVYKAALRP